jgi:hypothetical protein
MTCSQVSRTSRSRRPARKATRPGRGSCVCPKTPSAAATALGTQDADRRSQAAVAYHHVGPRSKHQVAPSNDLTGGLYKCDEDIERSTTNVHRLPASQR